MIAMIMKQQKIYTLVILLTTFALLWETEKAVSSSALEAFTSVNANEWIKENFAEIKCESATAFSVELPAKIEGMVSAIASRTY